LHALPAPDRRRVVGAVSDLAGLGPVPARRGARQSLRPPDDGWDKCFCANCGSQLFSKKQDGTMWGVRIGALDEDPGVPLKHRQFVAYAATWEPIPDDGVPHYDEGPPPS
jgi:hypothetical protein